MWKLRPVDDIIWLENILFYHFHTINSLGIVYFGGAFILTNLGLIMQYNIMYDLNIST